MAEQVDQDFIFDVALDTLRLLLRYESTSMFLIYAHHNEESQADASEGIAKQWISWLNHVGCNLRSDQLPKGADKGIFFRHSTDNEVVHDILDTQYCLLSPRLHTQVVETVIVCGSQLLEEYIMVDSYNRYREEIQNVFKNIDQDTRAIKTRLRQVVESNSMKSGFHHVWTEIALLELRKLDSDIKIIPCVLSGELNEVFPSNLFAPTTVKINFNCTRGPKDLYRVFFKLLRRLFEEKEDILKATEAAYVESIESLSRHRQITKLEVSEIFYQAIVKSRREDQESLSFKDFFNVNRNLSIQLDQYREAVESLHSKSLSRDDLEHRDLTIEERDCHQALLPTGTDHIHYKNQNPKRVSGTCLWALGHPDYIKWRDTNEKTLLWITADAGCGKSVLCRTIIDEDLPQSTASTGIIYFFFKDTNEDQRSAHRALLALLHQLISHRPSLVKHALPLFKERGCNVAQASFSTLWPVFMKMLSDCNAGNIVCVLDALDECNENERHELISSIEDFCSAETRSMSHSIQFLVTSRPYLDLKAAFADIVNTSVGVQLDGVRESESIKKEIDLVIRQRVSALGRKLTLPQEVQNYLQVTLIGMENRTYLWLRLVLDSLPKKWPGNISQMRKLIMAIPQGLDEVYESLLSKCYDQNFATKVLEIILAAYRPLTLEEIDVAVAISDEIRSVDALELEGSSNLQETLPARCGLMISVIDSKVYFIHQTVKEFLLRKVDCAPSGRRESTRESDEASEKWIWRGSFWIENAHQQITNVCIQILLLPEIRFSINPYIGLLLDYQREYQETYRGHHSFSSYAELYWADHCRDSRTINSVAQSFVQENMLTNQDILFGLGNAIQLAAAGRHAQIFYLLEDIFDINEVTEGHYETVLAAAVSGGDFDIVQTLLRKGADVNPPGASKYSNVLVKASMRAHRDIIHLLLDNDAEINAPLGIYGNALTAASRSGDEKTVQLLLDRGVDVNLDGERYGNPLRTASEEGHGDVVQLLLKGGAKVIHDESFGTALTGACRYGHQQVVQILLRYDVDVNVHSTYSGTPLTAASLQGNRAIVQMLLDKGANIEAEGRDPHRANPLQAASAQGHGEIVRLLLDEGADVDAQGGLYGSALQAATYNGHRGIVELLLSRGADIHARDGSYRSALRIALNNGDMDIVHLLEAVLE